MNKDDGKIREQTKPTAGSFLTVGTVLAILYYGMKIAARKWKETEDIDKNNPYIEEENVVNSSTSFYETGIKPVIDKVLSFMGLLLLSPIYAGIALAVYLDDPGPVFFMQKRVGKNKTFFMLHKFRSMKMSTPHDVPTHQLENPEQYITSVGKILRKTSLDELPQIWDIFRGKMSIIGPRPALWNQDDLVEQREYYHANDVLPGLTGLAQIEGRDELEILDKAKLDGKYVKILHKGGLRALLFDIHCFLGTIKAVVGSKGVVEGGTGSLLQHTLEDNKKNKEEAGFNDYGYLQTFTDNQDTKKRILITGENSYLGESFKTYVKKTKRKFTVDTVDMIGDSWKEKDFKGFDSIFHVAGIAHADIGKMDDQTCRKYYEVNTHLAIEAAKKAKESGVKQFVFMSSMIIYGEDSGYGKEKIIDEYTVPKPTSVYGDSKWQADKEVRKLSSSDFSVAVLRAPMIYGKGGKGNYSTLSKLAKKIPIFPMIDNQRSMLYIDNLCEFLCLLMMSGKGGIYFPQNQEYTNTSMMVKEIARATGHKIWLAKWLNPAVSIVSHIPGKIGKLTNKAFGNAVYAQHLSTYHGLNYQKYDLSSSIYRTENEEIQPLMPKDEPLVSIITAAYNCSSTIGETITSVQQQTYQNWEMIIVNDASTDNTTEIVHAFMENDHRLKLYSLKENSGTAVARNTAIKYAHGRFIAFLDSDDLWKPQKLERQIAFMLQKHYAFTFTAYEQFYHTSDKRRKVFTVPKSINYRQYLRNTIIGNLTVIMDKEQITDLHVESGYLEDVLTWMYYLKRGYTAYGLNENLASYRVNLHSKSGNKLENAKRYYRCLKDVQGLSAMECLYNEISYLFHAFKKRMFTVIAINEEEN